MLAASWKLPKHKRSPRFQHKRDTEPLSPTEQEEVCLWVTINRSSMLAKQGLSPPTPPNPVLGQTPAMSRVSGIYAWCGVSHYTDYKPEKCYSTQQAIRLHSGSHISSSYRSKNHFLPNNTGFKCNIQDGGTKLWNFWLLFGQEKTWLRLQCL